jgi:hypothetical protein
MDITALAGRATDSSVRDGLHAKVADIDEIVKALRDAVFALQQRDVQ